MRSRARWTRFSSRGSCAILCRGRRPAELTEIAERPPASEHPGCVAHAPGVEHERENVAIRRDPGAVHRDDLVESLSGAAHRPGADDVPARDLGGHVDVEVGLVEPAQQVPEANEIVARPVFAGEPPMKARSFEILEVVASMFRGLALLGALDLVTRHARECRLGHVEDEARATGRGHLLYQPQQEAPNDEWIAKYWDVDAVDRAANRVEGRVGQPRARTARGPGAARIRRRPWSPRLCRAPT
jgi:hypothetical protein